MSLMESLWRDRGVPTVKEKAKMEEENVECTFKKGRIREKKKRFAREYRQRKLNSKSPYSAFKSKASYLFLINT